MDNNYIVFNGKKLRKGYTTGSCAAAAAKAATIMLYTKEPINCISIDTPSGIKLNLDVYNIDIQDNFVSCAIIKDGGDDPDVTTGLKIFAKASYSNEIGIEITTGEGIGIVTKQGLKIEVGEPAINPIPLKMIHKEVKEVLEVMKKEQGILLNFYIPNGVEVAKRTLNSKLGIIGGISILGTTGIVTPMSEEAIKESLALELSTIRATDEKTVVFLFGNYGESFANEKLKIKKQNTIKISNFVGFMLEKASEYKFEKVLIIGHIGKLVKVAGGIFHTHSKVADGRMEIMTAYAALEGANKETLNKIYNCITTKSASKIINENSLNGVYKRIVDNVSKRCQEHLYNDLEVGAILFDDDNNLLGIDNNAKKLIEGR